MKTFVAAAAAAGALALVLAGCSTQPTSGYTSTASDFGPFSAGVQTATNVIYDPSHGLALDVYAPQGSTDAPLIVFFYGDRWERGNKADYRFVGEALAQQGFVTMIADYRFYPPATYKQFLADCANAVVWARDHAARYGASPGKLFVMGFSAGAYNAAMLALDPAWLKAAGGNRNEIAGMIGISGPYDFLPITASDLRAIFWPPSEFKQTQPLFWANGSNPPMLLIASAANRVANPDATRALFSRIKAAGGTVEQVIYDNLTNRDTINVLASGAQQRADEMKNIVAFVHRTLTKAAARKAAAADTGIQTQPSPPLPDITTTAPLELPAPAQSVGAPASVAAPAQPASVEPPASAATAEMR